jgi:uncharacterized membrane protein YkvA (DUF1232 family)
MSETEYKSLKKKQPDSKFLIFMKENWPSLLALIYVLSPIDLIPEALIPVVGYADDVVIVGIELFRRWYVFNKKNRS